MSTENQLTDRQREVFHFCLSFPNRFPTSREIADHFQFGQTAAMQNIQALHRKGYLIKDKRRYLIAPEYKEQSEIQCLQRIRDAVGDPNGKLMQDELVEVVKLHVNLVPLKKRREIQEAYKK